MGIRTGPFGYLQRVIRQVWVVSLTCRLGLSYAMGEFVLWSRKREKNRHASLDFVLMPRFLRTSDGAISSDIALLSTAVCFSNTVNHAVQAELRIATMVTPVKVRQPPAIILKVSCSSRKNIPKMMPNSVAREMNGAT